MFNKSIKGWAGHYPEGNSYGNVTEVYNKIFMNIWDVLRKVSVWTKNSKWLNLPNDSVKLLRLNRPHNCQTLDMRSYVDLTNDGISQIFFYFHSVTNKIVEILLEDKAMSCSRTLKTNRLSAKGERLKHERLNKGEAHQYVVEMKQSQFN